MMIIASSVLFGISIFLLLESNMIRRVFGLVLLGSSINLIILICGRLHAVHPAFIGQNNSGLANPLPQALILTAIVIGFGLLTFLCALLKMILAKKQVTHD